MTGNFRPTADIYTAYANLCSRLTGAIQVSALMGRSRPIAVGRERRVCGNENRDPEGR